MSLGSTDLSHSCSPSTHPHPIPPQPIPPQPPQQQQRPWDTYPDNHVPAALKQDLDALHQHLLTDGALRPDRFTSLRLGGELFTLAFISTVFLVLTHSSLWFLLLSGAFLALFYLRSAFYAHDLLHGQLVSSKHPKIAKHTALWMVSLVQGLSATWWRHKHGTHHHAPNAYKNASSHGLGFAQPLDSDIDTMPFICWSRSFLTQAQRTSGFVQAYLRLQCYAFWPIITTLRFVWIMDSFKQAKAAERLLMIIHHLATFAIAMGALALFTDLTPLTSFAISAAWLILANLFSGALLGTFALISHSGMQLYEQPAAGSGADGYAKVFKSTRNIHYHPVIFYLSGGLSHQIEHHLFATLKRQHLPTVSAQVQALCRKHGFDYHSVSLWQALTLLHRSLKI